MNVFKKNKFHYYLEAYLRLLTGQKNFQKEKEQLMRKLGDKRISDEVLPRVAYYNRLNKTFNPQNGTTIESLRHPISPKTYYHDTYRWARYFGHHLKIDYVFGDVDRYLDRPSITKSRPIGAGNENSVLLNLDWARHFVFVKDSIPLEQKIPKLIGRAAVHQPHRIDFYQKYFGNPMTDLGQINKTGGNPDWIRPKIKLTEHLKYLFILSLQGNDVATNLKWIMSSNSVPVMPTPTLETWFMEGKLEGGRHFIEISPDYSDLEEKIIFYTENTKLCREISQENHQFILQFMNKEVEAMCSLLVLERYFSFAEF